MYSHYAQFYDQGQLHFSILMEQYIHEVLEIHHPPQHPGRWIDLACGTGSLALMLADEGWDVLGLDRAAAMLREAQRKARGGVGMKRMLRFRRADMRDWTVSDPVDCVSCCFDSLNYLLDETELESTFACAFAALVPGGLWLFDLNTPYFLEHVWQPVEVEEREGYVHVMQSQFNAERCVSSLTLTGFSRRPDGLYERFEEFHAERGYDHATVQRLLEAVGFDVEMVYECFILAAPKADTHRWFWVARKPN